MDGFFLLVAFARHLGEVGLAGLLRLRPVHPWLYTTDLSLGGGVLSAEVGFGDAVLDLGLSQELALVQDILSPLLELDANRGQLGSSVGTVVRTDVLIGDIVLHPVDVKRARLSSVHA